MRPPPTVVPRAQYDPIAAGGHDRPGETELREPGADARHPCDDVGGAVVDVHARRQLAAGVEGEVEAVAAREGARRDEGVAAPQLVALDARQRDRDPLARLRTLDRPVVHLDAPNAHRPPARLEPQLVALADRPRPERPRRDGADPAEREGAVDVEAHRPSGARARRRRRRPRASRATRRDRAPCARSSPRRPPRERAPPPRRAPARASPRRRDPPSSGRRRPARSRAGAAPQVLVRLRPRALAGVDHEQEEVDPACARHHRADEVLVPGHVDDRDPRPAGQLERRVAEVDRDAALALLRQPVGVPPVSASTSVVLPWSMCPAVPTVSGIATSLGPPRFRAYPVTPACR